MHKMIKVLFETDFTIPSTKFTMKTIHNVFFLLFILILTIVSCKHVRSNDPVKNSMLAGCWKGGMIENNTIVKGYHQLRLLSFRPDSTLALTAIFELSPRSRLWLYDTEINYQGDTLSWLAHKGYLSENCDTMYITKSWKGDVSQWMFYRERDSDQMMEQLISSRNSPYSYKIPPEKEDGWYPDDIKNAGFEEGKIETLINQIKKGKYDDLHSLVICRKGKLVLEEYFALNGEIAGPYVNDVFRVKPHHMASVTKGIVSLLAGITIDQGLIEKVETPVFSFFPEYAALNNGDKDGIQLLHLLSMSAGLDWNQSRRIPMSDKRNDGGELYRSGNPVKYVLEKQVVAEPGSRFVYSNGLTVLAGVVIEKASGIGLDQFTENNLFNPLGILDYQWTRYKDGTFEADGGLALRSRDLAKVGQLMLNNGEWSGQQLVSKDWIGESLKPRHKLSLSRGYGYYWNEMLYEFEEKGEKAIFAPGDGGQFIAVLPALEMVIIITAGNYGTNVTTTSWNLIREEILPALD